MSAEPKLIQSSLNQTITRDGHTLRVKIYRPENDSDWILEVVNTKDSSFVWDERFDTDQAALDALQAALDEEGIEAFVD